MSIYDIFQTIGGPLGFPTLPKARVDIPGFIVFVPTTIEKIEKYGKLNPQSQTITINGTWTIDVDAMSMPADPYSQSLSKNFTVSLNSGSNWDLNPYPCFQMACESGSIDVTTFGSRFTTSVNDNAVLTTVTPTGSSAETYSIIPVCRGGYILLAQQDNQAVIGIYIDIEITGNPASGGPSFFGLAHLDVYTDSPSSLPLTPGTDQAAASATPPGEALGAPVNCAGVVTSQSAVDYTGYAGATGTGNVTTITSVEITSVTV